MIKNLVFINICEYSYLDLLRRKKGMSAILGESSIEFTFLFFFSSSAFFVVILPKRPLIVRVALTDLAELQTEMTADATLSV